MKYRATYVIERGEDDESFTVLLSASDEVEAPAVMDAYHPLMQGVSEKLERLAPMLSASEDDDVPPHVEVVPDAPTIKSAESKE